MTTENRAPGAEPSAIARRDFFYAGGRYAGMPGKQVMHGQMYVEALTPRTPRPLHPLVLFHGAGQTATNWMATPDGRPGWAEFFAGLGYTVYLVDQPARGRSPWQPGVDGELTVFTAEALGRLFTASASDGDWPQAKKQTQWPGEGHIGDPVFDAFYATQVPYLADFAETQRLVQEAGAALLDRIGPAILMTHSQAGTFGWLLADARPGLVKAIVALEPSGPPFHNTVLREDAARAWGLTDLVRCWQQRAPARRLPNLAAVPVLVLTGEASYHAVYDHCTARYLAEAGVAVTTMRLEEYGIHGNGHMLILEKNSLDIAGLIGAWLARTVPAPEGAPNPRS